MGFGYAVPYAIPYDYYDPPEPVQQPVEPAVQPDKNARTLFEHDGKPLEVHLVLPKETPETPASPEPQVQDEPPGPPTILVFRDGKRQEIQNYAILGDKLIILSEDRARRIALAELDLDATVKANEEQGVDFRLPGKG